MTPDLPEADEPRVRCFACAELVHSDARKCRWCGEWYADLASTPGRNAPNMTAAQALEAYPLPDEDDRSAAPALADDLRPEPPAPIVLEVGGNHRYDDLPDRMHDVRRRIAAEYGVVVAPVQVRMNADLEPGQYWIHLRGNTVAQGDTEGTDDPAEALAGHVERTAVGNLATLLTREDVAALLNSVRADSPMVVQELVPNLLSLGQLRQVLQQLVAERVPVRDLSTILNALADNAVYTKDPQALAQHVRGALAWTICSQHADPDGSIHAVMLSPDAERAIQGAVQLNETGQVLVLDPATSKAIADGIGSALAESTSDSVVVVVPPKIRRHVRTLLSRTFTDLPVLAYSDIVEGVDIRQVATIDVPATPSMPPADAPNSDWLMS